MLFPSNACSTMCSWLLGSAAAVVASCMCAEGGAWWHLTASLMWPVAGRLHLSLLGLCSRKEVMVATTGPALTPLQSDLYSAGLARGLHSSEECLLCTMSAQICLATPAGASGRPPAGVGDLDLGCTTCWAAAHLEEGSGTAAPVDVSLSQGQVITGLCAVSGLHGMSTQALALQHWGLLQQLLTFD